MKKLIVVLSILVLCSLVIIGCGTQTPAPTTPAPTTPSAPAAPSAPSQPAAPATPSAPAAPSAPSQPAAPATPSAPAAPSAVQQGGNAVILTGSIPVMGAPWEGGFLWGRIGRAVFETLVTNDEKEKILPGLAESWDVAKDGKSVTFHLRHGVKFQDGTDFNAQAVKYNLEQWPPGSSGALALKNMTSVDVLDDYTVRLNLSEWDSLLFLRLSTTGDVLMCSPTAAQKPATPDNQAMLHMVGTGPYKLAEFKKDISAKFVRFDGYWGKKTNLDSIEFRGVADSTVKLMSFEAGDGNFIEPLLPKDRNDLEKMGYITGQGTTGFVALIIPSGSDPNSPFSNLKVRQAVEYAIDKVGMYHGLFQNRWPPAYEQAQHTDPYFNPEVTPRVYDVAKAKQLLAEAGYPSGFKTVIHGDTRGDKDQLVAWQTYLKDVGIDATLDMADPGRYNTMANSGWDGLLIPGYPNPSTSPSLFDRFGNSAYWTSMYHPAGWFDKWDAIKAQMDESIRVDQLKQLIKIMADQAMVIPLYETNPQWATDNGKGQIVDLDWCGKMNSSYWNTTGVWMKK
jgi:peptide/nickel transport system substrate-binding protein